MVKQPELEERWPDIFGPDGVVSEEQFEELQSKAYDIQLTDHSLIISFLFENEEVGSIFQAGADMASVLAPVNMAFSSTNLVGGSIVYVEMDWMENRSEDD